MHFSIIWYIYKYIITKYIHIFYITVYLFRDPGSSPYVILSRTFIETSSLMRIISQSQLRGNHLPVHNLTRSSVAVCSWYIFTNFCQQLLKLRENHLDSNMSCFLYNFTFTILYILTFNFQNVKKKRHCTTSIIRLLSPPQNHKSINTCTSNAHSHVSLLYLVL